MTAAAPLVASERTRMEGGRAVEMQALWDIPELMMQAGVWPMAPSLGRDWRVPGPASQDGLRIAGDGAAALGPKCSWYGPAGIGTTRGIEGFRRQHQIPFLNGMPDRRALIQNGHFFGQGDYVGFTAWPGMEMTLGGGGWLGIAPSGQNITMRSLDFWRLENGLIRENWVLVDLLDVFAQLGVDVLARMREMTA